VNDDTMTARTDRYMSFSPARARSPTEEEKGDAGPRDKEPASVGLRMAIFPYRGQLRLRLILD
jgi:hypothetical protein